MRVEQDQLKIAPFFRAEGRCDDIALDFDFAFAFEEAEDIVLFLLDGDKLGHRLAAFGDYYGLAFGLDFVHDS